jgi:hypothetical protein
MEAEQFDKFTRQVSVPSSRRRVLLNVALGALTLRWSRQLSAAGVRADGRQTRPRGKRPGPHACRGGLRGGIVATFDVVGERFRVWVTNPQTIQQILDLQDGTSQATIPNGRLLRGPGRRRHNVPWHWHLDPEAIEMAENVIELCDALPSFVEANRREFITQVGQYCPWSAEFVSVADCRQTGAGR